MPIAMAGAQVQITNGKLGVVDGPFVETKEVIGGYAIFELRDKEEAMASAKEFMQLHLDHMPGWEGTCEVRVLRPPGVDGACRRRACARTPDASFPKSAVGGDDGRRHQSHHPRGLADRAAAADHQPVADAARRAAGRGPDAGSAAGGARTLARHGRAGKARGVADGDGQTARAGSIAPPPHARSQARDADTRHGAGAADHARSGRRAGRRYRRRIAAADLHRLPSAICRARPARRWRCG